MLFIHVLLHLYVFNKYKPILNLRTYSCNDWTTHYVAFFLSNSFLCLVRIFVRLYFLIFTTFDSFAVGHVRGEVGTAIYWLVFEGGGNVSGMGMTTVCNSCLWRTWLARKTNPWTSGTLDLRYPVALANFNQVFTPRRSALAPQSI